LIKTGLSDIYRHYIACLNKQDWPNLEQFVHDEVSYNGRWRSGILTTEDTENTEDNKEAHSAISVLSVVRHDLARSRLPSAARVGSPNAPLARLTRALD